MFSFSALSWKPLFLFFSLFSAAQDNITEVVAELSSISCFFAFFLFLYFAFCFCYCELLFACSRISHGRNDARREVGGLDRARPSPEDNKDYFANCDHSKSTTKCQVVSKLYEVVPMCCPCSSQVVPSCLHLCFIMANMPIYIMLGPCDLKNWWWCCWITSR